MRDEVLGAVAHDLRNPLGTVLIRRRRYSARRGTEPDRAIEAVGRAAYS